MKTRAERQPAEFDGEGGYSAHVTRRWRSRNPARARWQARRNNLVRTRAATWVRRNRPDVWSELWAQADAEEPEPEWGS